MTLWLKSVVLSIAMVGLVGSIKPTVVLSATFDFTGSIVAASPHSLGGIFTVPILSYPSSSISGAVTFDGDAVDSNGSPTVGFYGGAIQSLSLSVSRPMTADAYQFGLDLSGSSGRPVQSAIMIDADGAAANQSFALSASVENLAPAGPIVDGDLYFAREFSINLIRPSGPVFADDTLPDVPPAYDLFSLYSRAANPNGQFRLIFSSSHGDHVLIGNLMSFTVSPGGVAPIPVPAAAYLFGTGLLGLAGLARRRSAKIRNSDRVTVEPCRREGVKHEDFV